MRAAWLIVLAMTALSSVASAQTASPIMVTVREFPGRSAGTFDLMDLATTAANPISAGECDTNILFRFANLDSQRAQLQFYEGSNCNDVSVRTDESSTECEPLPIPSTAIDGNMQVEVSIRAGDLVPCETGTGSGVQDVWVLAVDNESSTVDGAGQQHQFDIAFDFSAPGGPTDFEADGGESSIELTWDSSDQVTTYEVFLDPTGCADGTYTGSALADPENPDPAALFDEFAGPAESYQLVWPDGIPIGSEAAVAIRGIDSSGNAGELSTVVCVERIEVTSWRDRFCMENPEACDDSGGCAVAPGSRAPLALFGVLAALGLALVRRIR